MARLLALGPHPDDLEIAMGGTIAALLAQGHELVMCDLTNGEPTPRGTPERRAAEAVEAARLLGVERRITLPLPNRSLTDSVENRTTVAEVMREVRPDALFVPYWVDAHPDHVAACALVEAARFYSKFTKTQMRGDPFYPGRIFHYVGSHYRLHVKPSFIFDITETFERKLQAVGAYASQFEERGGRVWIQDLLAHTGAYWGQLIGRRYGEPFICREELGVQSLEGLLLTGGWADS